VKEIQLTQGYVALVDDEDYPLVSQYKWYARIKKRKDSTVRGVYAARNTYPYSREQSRKMGKIIIVKLMFMHRLILGLTDGSLEVDHIDGDGLHNWRSNLRTATTAQNRHNSPAPVDNTSGFKGVSWNKRQKRWGAYITAFGKRKHLGWFVNKEEAAQSRAKAEIEMFGEFARPTEAACLSLTM